MEKCTASLNSSFGLRGKDSDSKLIALSMIKSKYFWVSTLQSKRCQCLFIQCLVVFSLVLLDLAYDLCNGKFLALTNPSNRPFWFPMVDENRQHLYRLFAVPFSSHLSISRHRSTQRWLVRPLVFICISVCWTRFLIGMCYIYSLSVCVCLRLCYAHILLNSKFLFYFR